MRIAIVDDIARERAALRQQLENQLAQRCAPGTIEEYESGEEFLAAAREQPFSVAFLDIYMHGMTGMEAAKELREFDAACSLIFTTTSTDHALDGFRVRAMHYLVKPYGEGEITALMEELFARLPTPDRYLEIKANGSDIRLPWGEIRYAEHFSHQITIHTTGGKTLTTRQTFRTFVEPLQADSRFFVCSRGVIVNLDHAADLDGAAFTMEDGKKLGVSRDLLKPARQAFMERMFQRGRV